MWRLHFVSLAALHIASSTASIAWNQENCNLAGTGGAVRGLVTDAICAKFSLCSNINEQFSDLLRRKDSCDGAVYCLWRPELGRCVFNRDAQNNVCVPAEEVANLNPNCHNITQGICPLNWQVKRDCCLDNKYDGKLQIQAGESWVCCNTPCESLYNTTVSLPSSCSWADHSNVDQCGPNGRSLLGVDRRGNQHLPSLARSYGPEHVSAAFGLAPRQPIGLGQVIPGFSGLGSLPSYPFAPGIGVQSYMPGLVTSMPGLPVLQKTGVTNKPQQTEEITVDDVMNLLIESLATDDDMFEYKAEVNSDPWYGKQKTGGVGDSIKFVNPSKFINQLYSTPYGLATGNWQAGAQNIPVPPVLPYGGALAGYPAAGLGGYGYPAPLAGNLPGGSTLPFGFTLPTVSGQQQQQPGYQAPQQPAYQAPVQQQYQLPQQQQYQQLLSQPQQLLYQPLQQQQPQQLPYRPPQQPQQPLQQQQQQLPYQPPQQPQPAQQQQLPYQPPPPQPQQQQSNQQQLPYQPPQQPQQQAQQQAQQQPSQPEQAGQQQNQLRPQINPYVPPAGSQTAPQQLPGSQPQLQINPYIPLQMQQQPAGQQPSQSPQPSPGISTT